MRLNTNSETRSALFQIYDLHNMIPDQDAVHSMVHDARHAKVWAAFAVYGGI